MSTYNEIFEAVKAAEPTFHAYNPEKDTQTSYFRRLVEGVNKLPEDIWNALPTDAGEWYESAVAAIKDDKDIPAPEGFLTPTQTAAADAFVDDKGNPLKGLALLNAKRKAAKAAAAAPTPVTEAGKPAAAKAAKPEAKKAKPAVVAEKKPSARALLVEFFCANTEATALAANEMLAKHGVTTSPANIEARRYAVKTVKEELKSPGTGADTSGRRRLVAIFCRDIDTKYEDADKELRAHGIIVKKEHIESWHHAVLSITTELKRQGRTN